MSDNVIALRRPPLVGSDEHMLCWYDDHSNLLAFARHMVETDNWDAQALLAYLEKPWKWTPEHDARSLPTGGKET